MTIEYKKLLEVHNIKQLMLEDFVSGKSIGSFEKHDFISTDQAEWALNNVFLIAEERVKSMKVVNDQLIIMNVVLLLFKAAISFSPKTNTSFSFCCKWCKTIKQLTKKEVN